MHTLYLAMHLNQGFRMHFHRCLISQLFLFQHKWGAKRLEVADVSSQKTSSHLVCFSSRASKEISAMFSDFPDFKIQNEPKDVSSDLAETQLFELFYQHRLYSSVCQQLT